MEKVTALDGAKIADAVYTFANVGEYKIFKNTDTNQPITYTNPATNLQLALYKNSATGDYVIAVRGTEPAAYGDWDTNIRMLVSTLADMLPSAFVEALQVINPLMETYGLNSSNTSIVGHSMGGSIAQYLGSVKGFETLTYNAYGVGNMNMVPDGSTVNITNYITMHDPVSILPRSQMVGTTYMLQDETLTGALGHGISNFTSIDSWVRGYSIVNDPRSIDVIDGIGSSGLDSIYEAALRLSEGREFAMINGSMDDVILGGDINNTLISGGGKDTLIGGKGFDRLQGGADYDNYDTDNGDIVVDDLEGRGIVYFEGELLSGGTKDAGSGCASQSDGSEVYKGDGGEYTLNGSTLTFAKDGKILTINDFKKRDGGYIGITLKDNEGDGGNCSSSGQSGGDGGNGLCPKPINPVFDFNFSLPIPSQPVTHNTGTNRDEERTYSGGGGGGGSYTPHTYTPVPTPVIECVNSPIYHSTGLSEAYADEILINNNLHVDMKKVA